MAKIPALRPKRGCNRLRRRKRSRNLHLHNEKNKLRTLIRETVLWRNTSIEEHADFFKKLLSAAAILPSPVPATTTTSRQLPRIKTETLARQPGQPSLM